MSTTPPLAVSLLLLLFLLLPQAQGIRLEKGFISVKQQNKNIHEDSTVLTKKSESTAASGVLRKDCGHDDHCSSSGSSRKLITVRSSTTTSKNEKNIVGKQIGNPKAEEEVATTRQQYPNLIDLTEMDYSPARKKPPIHN
ncbi:PREDICTED: uncharacterized protein LOC101307251 [Fragaria vesca subsp. vesca]|uniref:uncharacterized protein LOC101307251 n=1 Tax=Fragaria vesca subsp. vesca TaxID=101020 RepID=UPI0002C2E833|nr:PREDICTED: uncharacterized protein LOC101307251 [Fragaria vesca subsp. vesca]